MLILFFLNHHSLGAKCYKGSSQKIYSSRGRTIASNSSIRLTGLSPLGYTQQYYGSPVGGGINGRVGIYEGGGVRFLLFPDGKKVCKDDREWLSGERGQWDQCRMWRLLCDTEVTSWPAFQDLGLEGLVGQAEEFELSETKGNQERLTSIRKTQTFYFSFYFSYFAM